MEQKFIITDKFLIGYNTISQIIKTDDLLSTKQDKKGNTIETKKIYRVIVKYCDTNDYSQFIWCDFDSIEERDSMYNDIIEQVKSNNKPEKKTNSKGKTILAE